MLKIKSKTPTPPPIEEEVVEERPLEVKVYMDYIGEEGYVYKYSKEKGKYYKSSICLMGPKGNPGIRGPKGDPGAGADVDLSQYASKSYVDNKISDLINNAPEVLNTLGELATKVGDLMPLHGNTGDVDGFKLSYINGENADPVMLELYKAMSALNYNNDNPAGNIVLSTVILDTSSLYGSGIQLSPNGRITITSSSMSSNDISGLVAILTDDRFGISRVNDSTNEPLLFITQDYISLDCENGRINISETKFDLSSSSGFRFTCSENLPLIRRHIDNGTSNTYPILDEYYTKTINGQSLFWNGESESTKNIELVTKTELEETEEVIATALTDLDTRINDSIKSVKVNGTALTPDANKAVDISVPPGSFILDIVIDPESEDVTIDNSQISYGYMTVTTTNLDVFTAIDNAYNAGKSVYVRFTAVGPTDEVILLYFSGKDSNQYNFDKILFFNSYSAIKYELNIRDNGLITIVIQRITIPQQHQIIRHGTEDTGTSNSPYVITFNDMHVWGTVTNLNLLFQLSLTDDVVEYMIEFTSGSTATTLSLPSYVEWADSCGVLTVEANKRYLISIMNGIGVWCSVSTT